MEDKKASLPGTPASSEESPPSKEDSLREENPGDTEKETSEKAISQEPSKEEKNSRKVAMGLMMAFLAALLGACMSVLPFIIPKEHSSKPKTIQKVDGQSEVERFSFEPSVPATVMIALAFALLGFAKGSSFSLPTFRGFSHALSQSTEEMGRMAGMTVGLSDQPHLLQYHMNQGQFTSDDKKTYPYQEPGRYVFLCGGAAIVIMAGIFVLRHWPFQNVWICAGLGTLLGILVGVMGGYLTAFLSGLIFFPTNGFILGYLIDCNYILLPWSQGNSNETAFMTIFLGVAGILLYLIPRLRAVGTGCVATSLPLFIWWFWMGYFPGMAVFFLFYAILGSMVDKPY